MHTYHWRHSPTPNALLFSASSTATATSTAGWTPASVTTAFWYDASDTATLYSDAGTTLATTGQAVRQWNDKSGNSRHLSQASTGSRPTRTPNVLNSLGGLSYDAEDDYMTSTAFTQAQPFFIMYVARAPTNFYTVWLADNSAADPRPVLLSRNEVSPSEAVCVQNGTPKINLLATAKSTGFAFYAQFESTSSSGRITGQAAQTSTSAMGATGIANGIIIASTETGATSSIGGDVLETFCIPSATSQDRTDAIAYVADKWGLSW